MVGGNSQCAFGHEQLEVHLVGGHNAQLEYDESARGAQEVRLGAGLVRNDILAIILVQAGERIEVAHDVVPTLVEVLDPQSAQDDACQVAAEEVEYDLVPPALLEVGQDVFGH